MTMNNTLVKPKRMETVQVLNKGVPVDAQTPELWRRACGCVRTSDKLRQILEQFPEPPPPTPAAGRQSRNYVMRNEIIPPNVLKQTATEEVLPNLNYGFPMNTATTVYVSDIAKIQHNKTNSAQFQERKIWQLVMDLVSLIQLSVVATALAIYYLIYCYMQLVYYTLRSAVYFHHADGPMKVTIAVVTVTSIIIGLHVITRLERFLKIV